MGVSDSAWEERVLVLAPTIVDASLILTYLPEAGIGCQVCQNLEMLCTELKRGVGVLLLTDDVLSDADTSCLTSFLKEQPSWSDLPILLLSSSGADSPLAVWALELLGNVTVLERPTRLTTLISALRAAQRARVRQYEVRGQVETLRTKSERLRLLWEAAAVLLTTEQPDTMMRGLFTKIAPHFDLDAYFNFMVDETGKGLRLESCFGIPEETAHTIARLNFGQAICGTVAQLRKPITASWIQQSTDPKTQLVKQFGMRVYACNPLMAGSQLLGTLSFASKSKDDFDHDELEFLQTVCHYVAYAYERLRLIGRLRAEDAKKDEFLATLAHELRNPLAPIRNAAQYIRIKGAADPAIQNAREIIDRQVRQMTRLVDDLLEISRITQGKVVLQKERINLKTVLNNALESSRPLIEEAAHHLSLHIPAGDIFLMGDGTRLAQVFGNLLTNAAKYTDPGGRISLTVEVQEKQVLVTVSDNGIGVDAIHLPKLFDMFSQVAPALERSKGGLGIGLALVKSLVTMHDGTVTVTSNGIGQGSEFIVRLPLLSLPSAKSPSIEGNEAMKNTQLQCRILVADDNVDSAHSLSLLLSVLGHDVRIAYNGKEAVESTKDFKPNVVLLDIGMPKMNGYEAAREIRRQNANGMPLLVAISGWGQNEDKRRAEEAGFDQHFTKPVEPLALEQLLARHCKSKS